jgi:putative ABC transport system permease protein
LVLASPVAWYFMHQWLEDFAYRIDIQWWVFALAGIVALLLAFLTISLQAIRAAKENPVKNLKIE